MKLSYSVDESEEFFPANKMQDTHVHDVWINSCFADFLNLFVPNAPFLYSLKTLENLGIFWCFQVVEKWCIGNKWVKVCKDTTYYFCNLKLLTTFCSDSWYNFITGNIDTELWIKFFTIAVKNFCSISHNLKYVHCII